MPERMDDLCQDIDKLDKVLARLLNERARLVLRVGREKVETESLCDAQTISDEETDKCILKRLPDLAEEGPIELAALERIFRQIILECRKLAEILV